MRLLMLGPRAIKFYAKTLLLFFVCIFIWWFTLKLLIYFGLGGYAYFITLPILAISIAAFMGWISIWPIEGGFKKTFKEDQKEYFENISASKQPWEK